MFSPACYCAGTRILTVDGELPIESLAPGQAVITLSGDARVARPVKWIGRRRINLAAHPHPDLATPVRIRRNAIADGVPHADLLVSPDHAIFLDGRLIAARQLLNGSTIRRETGWRAVEYFHLELDSHAILLAEGLPAESYLDTGNRGLFTNADEPLMLHPDLMDAGDSPSRQSGSCAPFASDENTVSPVWRRLAARAASLGEPAILASTTADPDLRVVAMGRTIKPIQADGDRAVFVLPRGTTEARLVSRAQSPTEVWPWLDDRRTLGVLVAGLVLRAGGECGRCCWTRRPSSRAGGAPERHGKAPAALDRRKRAATSAPVGQTSYSRNQAGARHGLRRRTTACRHDVARRNGRGGRRKLTAERA